MYSVGLNTQTTFCGAKDGYKFRRAANKLIKQVQNPERKTIQNTGLGSYYYNHAKLPEQPSLKERLEHAIYTMAKAIGDEHVTHEDRRLHEKLKAEHLRFEEEEDRLLKDLKPNKKLPPTFIRVGRSYI